MTRREAQIRNFNIMRLKGIYFTAESIMDTDLAYQIKEAINFQLIRMHASTPSDDHEKYRKEQEKIRLELSK